MQIKQHDDNGMDYFGITAGKIMLDSQGKEKRSLYSCSLARKKAFLLIWTHFKYTLEILSKVFFAILALRYLYL